jgi:hypothetical protein
VGKIETAKDAEQLPVGGVASLVAPPIDAETPNPVIRALGEVGMMKRTDRYVEATVFARGKLVGEVVDDPGDRAPRNRWWDGQVLRREEADANGLIGPVL